MKTMAYRKRSELVDMRFTTSTVPSDQRLDSWTAASSNVFGDLRVATRGYLPFFGEMYRLPLQDCELVSVQSSPVSMIRSGTPAAPANASEDVMVLKLLCAGSCQVNIAGQHSHLRTGDFMLMRAKPYATQFDEPVHAVILMLHDARLTERIAQLEPYINVPMRADQGGGSAILSKTIRSVWTEIRAGYGAHSRNALADMMWSLVDLGYPGFDNENPAPARRLERRNAALQIIDSRVRDPQFKAHELAKLLHVSERYVQSLFSDLDTTPSRYLMEKRLSLACEQLRHSPGRRISDIAMSVGITDFSYFSRIFKERYGMSALEYRRQMYARDNRN